MQQPLIVLTVYVIYHLVMKNLASHTCPQIYAIVCTWTRWERLRQRDRQTLRPKIIIHIISRPLPNILYEYEQNYLTGKEHRTFLCYFWKFYVKYNLFLSDAFEMKANFRSGKRIFKCKIRVELHRVPPQKNSSDLHEFLDPAWAGLGAAPPCPPPWRR